MRRLWITCVALVLLSGCSSNHSSAGQDAANKRAFVRELVGYCADVDRQLQTVNKLSRSIARQLDRFASQARSHTPPSAQRQQLDVLLTAIDDAVQQYQSAQTALSSGNGDAYHTALKQAERNDAERQSGSGAVRHATSCGLRQGTGRATAEPPSLSLSGVGSWGVIRCSRSSRWVLRCRRRMAGSGWPAA